MITLTIVAILAILLVIVLKNLFRKPLPKPAEDLANVKAADARVGDSLSAAGAGDQFADLDFTVDHRNLYDVGPRRWIELRGNYRDRRVSLYVSEGEELEVSAVLDARKQSLEELGMSEDDLAQLDQRQNTADNIEYDGKLWYYRFSKEFVLLKDTDSQGASFYGWFFREDGGNRLLLVRKTEGEPFSATISVKLNPSDITVYRAG